MSSAASDNPQAGAGRPLPKKEADLFKNVVKHYEMKQYKKAIKQADTILKKFPNHGETLAMKGLTLNYMSKRDEAHALVKQGLTMDMRSHVCWHVYGLLHRSDRNYNEAIKAYKQALRIDSDNLQILRDLSMLQIQMRDLHGFMVTRHTLLTLKSNGKPNWLAFAMARHLTGDLRGAVSVIDIYLGTLTEGSPELDKGFESGELALYRNSLLAEIPNNYEEALKHLQECEKVVVDKGAWFTAKAKYELKLGDFETAHKTTLKLFERGMTDDFTIHSLYMLCLLKLNDGKLVDDAMRLKGTRSLASYLPLTPEQKQLLRKAYAEELSPLYPKSYAVQRLPLALLPIEELSATLDLFCRKDLTKGVPSLCGELGCFFLIEKDGFLAKATDPVDIRSHAVFQVVVKLVDGYVENLTACNKFAASDEKEEAPSTQLWALYLRAGLYEMEGNYQKGVETLDKCLEHTPTAVDVYELKARMLQKEGDLKKAVEVIDHGRDLDRQDRYINNQTTRYMLMAGMEDEALKRISLFTRHEGNPEQNLFDMQCSWYELELAVCLRRKGEWGRSLKKFSAVVKHFADYSEDQFDFHAYCLRKVTLRSYIEVLRFEDTLYGEQYYFEAVEGIIGIYLHLHDNPDILKKDEEPDYSKMTAAERKKAKNIARKKKKAQEKKEADQKEKEAAANGKNKDGKKGGGKQPVEVAEEDPNGEELLKKDPLEESQKYASIVTKFAPKRFETWVLQYDVAMRRKKYLLALQALFRARAIDAERSEYLTRLVDFATKKDELSGLPGAVGTIVKEETPRLLENKSVAEYLSASADKIRKGGNSRPLVTRTAVAKAMVATNPGSVSDACALILNGGIAARGVTVQSCRDALATLKSFGDSSSKSAEQWISQVKERFPLMQDI